MKEFQHVRETDWEILKGLILRGMLSESVAPPGCKSAKNIPGQFDFENRTPPIPQVPVAYSVHVGEKIAQF